MIKHTFHLIDVNRIEDSGVLVKDSCITPWAPMIVVATDTFWEVDQNLNGADVVDEGLPIPAERCSDL